MNENPIIGDRYEHKLMMLKKNVDLAQEGKLTYDTLSEAGEDREAQSDQLLVEALNSQTDLNA